MKQRAETAETAGKSRGNSLLVSVLSKGKQRTETAEAAGKSSGICLLSSVLDAGKQTGKLSHGQRSGAGKCYRTNSHLICFCVFFSAKKRTLSGN